MPGSLHHLLSALGSPPGMADAMQLKPNWSILGLGSMKTGVIAKSNHLQRVNVFDTCIT